MTRGFVASLLVLLGGYELVFAQTAPAPPAAAPAATTPAPAAPAPTPHGDAPAPHADAAGPGGGHSLSGALDGGPVTCDLLSVEAEYVLWLRANRNQPVTLAQTGTGATETLGDEHLGRHILSGGRLAIGYWEADANPWVPGGMIRDLGVEARGFFVGQRTFRTLVAGTPTILRPFFDLNDEAGSDIIVAAPGVATGSILAVAKADVWGVEANGWKNLCYDSPGTNISLDVMAGVRYLDLESSIDIDRLTTFVPNPIGFPGFGGNRIVEHESFGVHNQFYGVQAGTRVRWYLENVIVTGQVQLAVGDTRQNVTIAGSQVRIQPDGTVTASQGGLLARPGNIGHFHKDRFTQVPELGFNIALPIREHLIASIGFTAINWDRIARAADQASTLVDITQLANFPAAARVLPTGQPAAVSSSQSNLWLVGLTFGIEVTW
jgi:hypothetical protein